MKKENEKILLSLVIPAYNASKTLENCLESILVQDLNELEIIIVNNGSKDSTQSIIEDYSLRYPNIIRFFNVENAGISNARHQGVINSNGKYIGFIDSDDTVTIDYLATIKDIITKTDSELIMICYNRHYTRRKNFFEKIYKYTKWSIFETKIHLSDYPQLICEFEVANWLRIVKRSLFENNGQLNFSDVRVGEDLETSLKWYLYANDIYITDRKIYNYIIRENSSNFVTKLILDFNKVLNNVCQFYIFEGKFERYNQELEHVFTQHLIISNLLRLMMTKDAEKLEKFDLLRDALITYFPKYHNNKYLKLEPFYIRFVVLFTSKYPKLFKSILGLTI